MLYLLSEMMLLCLYELFMWKSNVSCMSPFIFSTCVPLSCSFRCVQAGSYNILLITTNEETHLSINSGC